jgi:hypothetical protein
MWSSRGKFSLVRESVIHETLAQTFHAEWDVGVNRGSTAALAS